MNKKWIEKYVNTHPVYFYNKQKENFKDTIIEDFKTLGYEGEEMFVKNRIVRVRNIIIGNIKSAKHMIIVPYDTPQRVFWSNYEYYPQNGSKILKKSFWPTYVPIIVCYLLLLALIYGLPILGVSSEITLFITALYFAFLSIFIWKGFPAKHNATRNNAAIASALQIANNLPTHKKKDVVFVFTDVTNMRLRGIKALDLYLKTKNKQHQKIILHCIGQSDTVQIGYSKGMRKMANALKKNSEARVCLIEEQNAANLAMSFLKDAITISSGKIVGEDIVVYKTASNRDVQYNEEVLDTITNLVTQYVS